MIKTSHKELDIVLHRMWELQEKEAEDDVIPSHATMSAALQLVTEAAEFLPITFPRAAASTDGNGSIYLYWTKPDRMLQLTVPEDSSRTPFIYHRKGDDFGFERPILPQRLAYWLDWYATA